MASSPSDHWMHDRGAGPVGASPPSEEGGRSHRALCSLAPALEHSLHSKTNFEINLHLINILHVLWSVVFQTRRGRPPRCLCMVSRGLRRTTGCWGVRARPCRGQTRAARGTEGGGHPRSPKIRLLGSCQGSCTMSCRIYGWGVSEQWGDGGVSRWGVSLE